jgi:hypothetical protein
MPRRKAEFECSDLGMPQRYIPPEIAASQSVRGYGFDSPAHPPQPTNIASTNFTVFGSFAIGLTV